MRWLPPMESPSPSPVTIQTLSSGRLALRPVANARGAAVDAVHPVGVHIIGKRLEHPMPLMKTKFSRGMPSVGKTFWTWAKMA
jgi:hypothetical protein